MADAAQASLATDVASLFDQIAAKIIEQQEAIIGPIAVEQAKQISQLKIDWSQHEVDVSGDPQAAIDRLVEVYKELFGQIAVETCKEAVANFLPQLPSAERPKSLQ